MTLLGFPPISDATTIKVTGQIFNQSAYALVTLPSGIPNLPAADQPVGLSGAWDSIFSAGLNPSSPNLVTIPSSLLPSLQATLGSSVVLGLTIPANLVNNPAKWANYVLGEANFFLAQEQQVGAGMGGAGQRAADMRHTRRRRTSGARQQVVRILFDVHVLHGSCFLIPLSYV